MDDYLTVPTTPLEKELDDALGEMLARNNVLEAKLAEVQGRLDELMDAFERRGSLGLLQQIGADKSLPIGVRVRALGLAAPYETSKQPALNVNLDYGNEMQRVRLAYMERETQRLLAGGEPRSNSPPIIDGKAEGDPAA
jgi:hypothetical protein